MGQELYPGHKDLMESANDILGFRITDIMFESYLPAIPDRFAVWLALSPEPAKRQTPLPYGNDSETIFRTLIENDLNSMGRYMKTRWDLFAAELAKKPELAAALNAVSATEQQRELMQDFSNRNRPIIKVEEYRSLPRVWSWFFGKAAIDAFGPDTGYEKLKNVFSGSCCVIRRFFDFLDSAASLWLCRK